LLLVKKSSKDFLGLFAIPKKRTWRKPISPSWMTTSTLAYYVPLCRQSRSSIEERNQRCQKFLLLSLFLSRVSPKGAIKRKASCGNSECFEERSFFLFLSLMGEERVWEWESWAYESVDAKKTLSLSYKVFRM